MDTEMKLVPGDVKPLPSVTVAVVDGRIIVTPHNDIATIALPTLLRLAARQVENELGL
jgi:hypothetical protein